MPKPVLRELREQAGLTQGDVVRFVIEYGVYMTQGQLSNYERGVRVPFTRDLVQALSDCFAIGYAELVSALAEQTASVARQRYFDMAGVATRQFLDHHSAHRVPEHGRLGDIHRV